MVAAGIVTDDAHVELIEGDLVDMEAGNAAHAGARNLLSEMFVLAAQDAGVVSVQNALRISDLNLPQPDLVLLKPHAQHYSTRLPTVKDVLLLIEVSDSTLRYDRETKTPIYARHGVPEVWIVDVNGRQVLRYREPALEGYRQVDGISGVCAPQLLLGCRIDLDRLFPN